MDLLKQEPFIQSLQEANNRNRELQSWLEGQLDLDKSLRLEQKLGLGLVDPIGRLRLSLSKYHIDPLDPEKLSFFQNQSLQSKDLAQRQA